MSPSIDRITSLGHILIIRELQKIILCFDHKAMPKAPEFWTRKFMESQELGFATRIHIRDCTEMAMANNHKEWFQTLQFLGPVLLLSHPLFQAILVGCDWLDPSVGEIRRYAFLINVPIFVGQIRIFVGDIFYLVIPNILYIIHYRHR